MYAYIIYTCCMHCYRRGIALAETRFRDHLEPNQKLELVHESDSINQFETVNSKLSFIVGWERCALPAIIRTRHERHAQHMNDMHNMTCMT